MSDDVNNNSIDLKWKQKYFDHLDRSDALEKKLRARVNLAAEGLVALCDFSTSISKKLYKLCKPVRQTAQKDVFAAELPDLIVSLKQALAGLESETRSARDNTIGALRSSVDALINIDSSSTHRRHLRKLKKSLHGDDYDESALVERVMQFSQLLQKILAELNTTTQSPKPSLLGKILPGKLKADPAATANQHLRIDLGDDQSDNDDDAKTAEQLSTVLLHLVSQLDIPDALVGDATALKLRLQQDLDWHDLEEALEPVVELTLATVEWHYSHFGEFLEQINAQLDAVQNFLRAAQSSRNHQHKNHTSLNDSVCQTINDIEESLAQSEHLDELKQSISHKMHSIVTALADYEAAEQRREAELVGELAQLGDKLQEMEQQSNKMRAKLESQKQLARRDSVTQLPNRAAYDERIQFEFARWERYEAPFTLLLGDIDHFKTINDQHGHMAGDKVLKLVAQTLSQTLRETDFAARFGGEEFAILLPNTAADDAMRVAEKLRQAVAACPFHRRGKEVAVTISFGLSEIAPTDRLETLFERVDHALYQAKQQGRNRCCAN